MIANKDEFNALSGAGRLGNFLRSWENPVALLGSGYTGFVTIRSRIPDNKWFVPVADSHYGGHHGYHFWGWHLKKIRCLGGPGPEAFYFTEVPDPDTRRIVNLEARLSERGVDLVYERETTSPVRGIRDRGTWVFGLRAQAVLRTSLAPASYDTLHGIWQEHSTSIIEATEWSAPCGAFHQPLTIWEVRDF